MIKDFFVFGWWSIVGGCNVKVGIRGLGWYAARIGYFMGRVFCLERFRAVVLVGSLFFLGFLIYFIVSLIFDFWFLAG